jgi:hypothetical protein
MASMITALSVFLREITLAVSARDRGPVPADAQAAGASKR